MRRSWLPVAVFAVIVVLWEVLAQMDQSRVQVIPAPSDILAAMIRTRETLLTRHIPETLLVTLIGMGIAIVTGLIIAALLDFSPALRQAIYPLLVISQTIPLIALATVLVLVFEFGRTPKLVIVVLFCFFPITVSTLDGLAATDPDVVALLRAMGASRWQVWRMARLPAALPSFFSGLRIAATYSVTGAITGEYVVSQYGLGQYLRQAYSSGRIDQAFAGIVIVAILSIALVLIVSLIERLALPWFFTQSRQASWNEPGIY